MSVPIQANDYQYRTSTFSVEYYTKNPETGEGGWDIRFAVVSARNKTHAISLTKSHDRQFDVGIQVLEQCDGYAPRCRYMDLTV